MKFILIFCFLIIFFVSSLFLTKLGIKIFALVLVNVMVNVWFKSLFLSVIIAVLFFREKKFIENVLRDSIDIVSFNFRKVKKKKGNFFREREVIFFIIFGNWR